MSQTIIARTLRIMALLSSGHRYTLEDIGKRVGIDQRSVYRYLDTFREVGFNVEKVEDYVYRLTSLENGICDLSNIVYFSDEEAYIVNKLIDGLDGSNSLKAGLKRKLAAIYDSASIAEHIDNKFTARIVETLERGLREKRVVELNDYVSSYAGQTLDYRVEAFKFTANFSDIWAFDLKSEKNKRFKIMRIGEAVLTDEPWTKEFAHYDEPMDAFHCFGMEEYHVVLKMNNAAKNIMVEEYPLTEPDIRPIEDCVIGGELDQAWEYNGICRHLWGIGRFCLGQQLNLEVVECDALKDFLIQSADNILYTYGAD